MILDVCLNVSSASYFTLDCNYQYKLQVSCSASSENYKEIVLTNICEGSYMIDTSLIRQMTTQVGF